MIIVTIFLLLNLFNLRSYRELKEHLTVDEIQKVEEINKNLVKVSPENKGSSE